VRCPCLDDTDLRIAGAGLLLSIDSVKKRSTGSRRVGELGSRWPQAGIPISILPIGGVSLPRDPPATGIGQ